MAVSALAQLFTRDRPALPLLATPRAERLPTLASVARNSSVAGGREQQPNIDSDTGGSLACGPPGGDHPACAMSTPTANIPPIHASLRASRRANGDHDASEPVSGHESRGGGPAVAAAILSSAERTAVLDARSRALELLENLLADRALIEARLASGGRVDPMKTVRGASSLERAISTTREMIAAYDAMLGG